MPLKVALYDPNGQGYAPRIKHEDWERHRLAISRLHAKRTPRKLMIQQLRDNHNFHVTIGQLQAKCKEWGLRVYKEDATRSGKPLTKKTPAASLSTPQYPGPGTPLRQHTNHAPAFHIATESGLSVAWAADYRVHPPLPIFSSNPGNLGESPVSRNAAFHDRSLPPEYIGGGLLANTSDSHWPLPEDDSQCEAMLHAGHYYYAVHAFQQAFSIYRAVYLYQRRHMSLSDPRLITTILQSSCAAVNNHQRNIMHSVLLEIGSSVEIDQLDPILVDSLQSASLTMVSSDAGNIENEEQVRARSAAYLYAINCLGVKTAPTLQQTDVQALLYTFEHSLLMQEHGSQTIHRMFQWCEVAIDHLQRDLDDIFVGNALLEEEYYRRIAQILSGHLLSRWHRQGDEHTDLPPEMSFMSPNDPCSFHFQITTTQALVALAFMIVDAVRCDPLVTPPGKIADEFARLWFLDAAKYFRRGIRVLGQLDERSRCIAFSDAFLERFYTSVSFRETAYDWTSQLPAIVDLVGISLAQQGVWLEDGLDADTSTMPPSEVNIAPSSIGDTTMEYTAMTSSCLEDVPMTGDLAEGVDLQAAETPPSPRSECNSIASFLNTYHRSLKSRLISNSKSGRSTPGDVISFGSSADFKFGVVATVNNSTDVDSLWQMIANGEFPLATS